MVEVYMWHLKITFNELNNYNDFLYNYMSTGFGWTNFSDIIWCMECIIHFSYFLNETQIVNTAILKFHIKDFKALILLT